MMLRRGFLMLPAAAALALAQTKKFPAGIRQGHLLAYDSRRRELLLYGGQYPAEESGDEPLWVLSDEGWRRAEARGPRSRSLSAGVYDSKRGKFVLYGGISNFSETRYGDLWEWDGVTWTEVSFHRLGPGPRDHHAMAYDTARERVVVYGGSVIVLAEASSNEIVTASQAWYSEVWEYDGTAWKVLASPGPGTRTHHSMAYDPVSRQTLLFGGANQEGQIRPETWGWDGKVWTKIAETGPSPRTTCAMACHEGSGQLVLYGGEVSTAQGFQTMGDTWVWNGSEWSERRPQNTPGPRMFHAMAYHADRQRVVLYAGSPSATERDDAWVWDGENWSPLE